jgi:D-alanyl-lipoteichoic acid acyltransferase DltB (MBOAT superfamily)
MLFNSYIFIFVFLPVTLSGFYALGNRGAHGIALTWLVAASFFFYAWWNPAYLGFILGSILFNYGMGMVLENPAIRRRKTLLLVGIAANLGFLGYFKYSVFILDNLSKLFTLGWQPEAVLLPLAISFFTFTQIAYLADAYKRSAREHNFLHYCLFVLFFPHLIAGPIVHHKELMPQFAKKAIFKFHPEYLMVGLSLFTLGLFKKAVFADSVAVYAAPVFGAAERAVDLSFFEAWLGAAAYTLQLYFDFSGYSDMAIGASYMFGVRLPINFNSPYQAVSIIDFWSRWHMTLSRFLRDYVYIPLGGNRKGTLRRYINLMLTMLLGGFWHGAGWTFIAWGALHGLFLIVNHAWRSLRLSLGWNADAGSWMGRAVSRAATLSAVILAWVFFRAETFAGATNMLSAMLGGEGISLPMPLRPAMGGHEQWLQLHGIRFEGMFYNHLMPSANAAPWVGGLLLLVLFAPNTQQMMRHYHPALENCRDAPPACHRWLQWRPSVFHAVLHVAVFAFTLMAIQGESEFLYFRF